MEIGVEQQALPRPNAAARPARRDEQVVGVLRVGLRRGRVIFHPAGAGHPIDRAGILAPGVGVGFRIADAHAGDARFYLAGKERARRLGHQAPAQRVEVNVEIADGVRRIRVGAVSEQYQRVQVEEGAVGRGFDHADAAVGIGGAIPELAHHHRLALHARQADRRGEDVLLCVVERAVQREIRGHAPLVALVELRVIPVIVDADVVRRRCGGDQVGDQFLGADGGDRNLHAHLPQPGHHRLQVSRLHVAGELRAGAQARGRQQRVDVVVVETGLQQHARQLDGVVLDRLLRHQRTAAVGRPHRAQQL